MSIFDRLKKKSADTSASNAELKGLNILGRYYRLEDITPIRSAGGLVLQGIDASSIFEYNDAKMLSVIASSSPRVVKYLSRMDISTKEAAEKFLYGLIKRTEYGYGFAYGIRAGQLLIGMIFIETPALNEKMLNFPHWNIDFFLMEGMENQGIMYQAVVRVLRMLKNTLDVPEVYAWVDPDNAHCLGLMSKLPFDEVRHDGTGRFIYAEGGRRARLFVCDLDNLRFETR